jgi:hypothetical protein
MLVGKIGLSFFQVVPDGIQFFKESGAKANKLSMDVLAVSNLENFFAV